MIDLFSRHVFTWFTSPAELRLIANDMEQKYASARPGEDITVGRVFGEHEELHIVINQESMRTGEP